MSTKQQWILFVLDDSLLPALLVLSAEFEEDAVPAGEDEDGEHEGGGGEGEGQREGGHQRVRGLGLVPPPPRHVQLGGVSATGANRVLQIGHRYEMLLAAAVEHGPHDDIVL